MRPLPHVIDLAALIAFGPPAAIAGVGPNATVVGTVTLTAADGGTFPGDGVRVTLACAGRNDED